MSFIYSPGAIANKKEGIEFPFRQSIPNIFNLKILNKCNMTKN